MSEGFDMLPRDEIVLNVCSWFHFGPQKTGGNGNVILQGGAPSAPPVMFHLSTASSTLLFVKFSKLTARWLMVAQIVDGSNFTPTNTRPCAHKQLILLELSVPRDAQTLALPCQNQRPKMPQQGLRA